MVTAYRLVIFDFDGTLADTYPWFVGVMNGVADRYRFRRVAEHEVDTLRGQSARQVIAHLGVASWKLPFIARHIRSLAARDSSQIPLFDGIHAMLLRLKQEGYVLAIASSNSERNIRRTLGPETAALITHYACGAGLFGKATKFRRLAKEAHIPHRQCICIGDEIRDAEAAREAGMAFGAVAWGFTNPDALQAQRPASLFRHLDEIIAGLCIAPGAEAR